MSEITAVSFVPKTRRARLRHVLATGDTGDLRWREQKKLGGSEFYFSGPAPIVMKTHAYITKWLATPTT
jgi:hypothetical protein